MNPPHDLNKLWQAVLGELEINTSRASFKTWFHNTRLIELNDRDALVGVPSNFVKTWLESRLHTEITQTIRRLTSQRLRVRYQIKQLQLPEANPTKLFGQPAPSPNPVAPSPVQTPVRASLTINRANTFETFVVGPSNRLAAASAQVVAKDPGRRHNPLFLYGGVGLGKTHLMHAIANEVSQRQPVKVLYIQCEDFTNEFVNAIQTKRTDLFKQKYRSIDLFLVDDIQFLSRKEGTQEEFFHTFNALHQSGRQIVMTSDRTPRQIPDLKERLSSRFAMGMVADIQPPDLETRQAIIQHKTTQQKRRLDPEVVEFLARKITTNIRHLEGALNRLFGHADLTQKNPTLEVAQEVLADLFTGKTNVSKTRVLETVARYFDLEVSAVLSQRRNRELVYPRQICMYLMRHELDLSYPVIGQSLGGKDHTTIMHGVSVIERQLAKSTEVKNHLSQIKDRLNSS